MLLLLRSTSFLNSIYVTQDSDFVLGVIDAALKLFPNDLKFLIAPIEKKK